MINWSNWTQQQRLVAIFVVLLIVAGLIYLGNLRVEEMIARVMIVLIAFPLHELAHAVVADRLGDPTPRRFGRITLNPLAHIDPLGSILMLLFGFGWATTPVNSGRFRGNRELGSILVSAAGPVSNLILAALIALLFRFDLASNTFFWLILFQFIYINIFLFVFNLLPIPPLDGFNILTNLLPPQMRAPLVSIAQYGSLFLMLILISPGVFSGVIQPPIAAIFRLLVGN